MADDWKKQLASATGYKETPQNKDVSKGGDRAMSIQFYKDSEKKIIIQELLDAKAKEWALSFIRPKFPKDQRMRNPKLTSAQLRRFHNDVRELEAKVNVLEKKEDFARVLPLIKMIKSKVAYACPSDGRERKVPEEFRVYMETMVDSIKEKEDFKAFSLCFEAVVGYFFGEGGR